MRDTNRSRCDKRHSQEDFVELVIFRGMERRRGTNVVILLPIPSHPFSSSLTFAPLQWNMSLRHSRRLFESRIHHAIYHCPASRISGKSEISSESRNRIANLKVSYAPTESSVVSQDLFATVYETSASRNLPLFAIRYSRKSVFLSFRQLATRDF